MSSNPENQEQARMVQIGRLWARAQPMVAALVAGAVVEHHDMEDVVAQVAETVITKFDQYDPARPFLPWALGIARLLVLRYYERKADPRFRLLDQDALAAVARAHEEIADELPARLAALRQCMEQVKGKSRRALELRYVHNLSPDAVSEAMGMSRNAVWVMLHRVRQLLKACVERRTLAEGGA